MNFKYIFLAAVAALSTKVTSAQSDTLDPIFETIETVVLTANKQSEKAKDIPLKIDVIKRRQIVQQMPQTSADALIQNGSVFVQKSQMGGGSPVIRGFEANAVLLVVDGIRMNNAIYRSGHLQNIITVDANALERMEVQSGPGSVIYGSDALGGVIHMYTINPKLAKDSIYYSANAFIRGASANKENTVHADFNFGKKNWATATSLTFSTFGDLRKGANNMIYDNDTFGNKPFTATRFNNRDTAIANSNPLVQTISGYSQVDLLQKVLFKQNNNTEHLFNLQFSSSSDVPRYDRLSERNSRNGNPSFSEWYYGPQQRFLGAYTFTKSNKKWFDLMKATASYQYIAESRFQRRFGNNNLNSTQEKLNIGGLNIDFLKNFKKKHELRYGAELIYNQLASEGKSKNIVTNITLPADSRYPDGSTTINAALYTSYSWEIEDKWIITAGGRLNYYQLQAAFSPAYSLIIANRNVDINNLVATGQAGLIYKVRENFRLIAQLGSGYRNPNVDDAAKTFERDNSSIVLPLNNLRPERVLQQELGFDVLIAKKLWIEARGFYTAYTDALAVIPTQYLGNDSILVDGVNLQVLSNTNISEAEIFGYNVELKYKLNQNWSAKFSYNYTQGRDLTRAVPLGSIPPVFASLFINYTKPKYTILFYTLYNGNKALADYSPNPEDNLRYATAQGTPAWFTLNLKGRYNINDNFRIQAGVENIMDLNYRYFASGLSAPGINGILSLHYSF